MHSDLLQSIDAVLELEEYKPTTVVNNSFTRLIHSVVSSNNESFNIPSRIRNKLRAASSLAESELEAYWAKKIIESSDPGGMLEEFPYIGNYRELVAREMDLVATTRTNSDDLRRALIVGSGPLPLTALCLSGYSIRVDHIDSSPVAMALCEDITNALKVDGDCILGTGESVVLVKQYDLILIAALAGVSQTDKQAIIDNVSSGLAPAGRIVVRSAKGARELLYPALDPNGFRGMKLLHEYHPTDHVINSVLVYAKEEK